MPRHTMPGADIAGRIDYLIRRLNPGDREYTHAEIAAGIERKTGIKVTPEYIGQLRAGKVGNPSLRTLAGLARFFGVPIDSFYDDEAARQVERDVELAVALRRMYAAGLAARLPGGGQPEAEDVIALVNSYLGHPDQGETGREETGDGDELAARNVEGMGQETPAVEGGQQRGGPQRED